MTAPVRARGFMAATAGLAAALALALFLPRGPGGEPAARDSALLRAPAPRDLARLADAPASPPERSPSQVATAQAFDAPVDPTVLAGCVLGPDPKAAPVEGATVELWREEGRDFACYDAVYGAARVRVGATRTDAAGQFRFAVLPGTAYGLDVGTDAGCGAARQRCAGGERVELRLGSAAVLSGNVADLAGRGIAGAFVEVFYADPALPAVSRFTDVRGAFQFDCLPAGEAFVYVESERQRATRESVTLVHGVQAQLEIALRDGASLRGVVRSAEGAPVQGAALRRAQAERGSRSDHEGRFEVGGCAPEAFAELTVTSPGFCEERVRVATGPEGSTRDVEIVLERGWSAHGTVQDEQGAPLEGVYVAAVSHRYTSTRELFGTCVSATTDEDGRFLLPHLRPEREYVLIAKKDPYGIALRELRAPQDPNVERMQISLAAGKVVGGSIVDEAGAGVEAARRARTPLRGHSANQRPYNAPRWTTTDAAGGFRFALVAPGSYELRVEGRVVALELGCGDSKSDLRISVERGAVIEGVVLDCAGRAVGGARVVAEPLARSPRRVPGDLGLRAGPRRAGSGARGPAPPAVARSKCQGCAVESPARTAARRSSTLGCR